MVIRVGQWNDLARTERMDRPPDRGAGLPKCFQPESPPTLVHGRAGSNAQDVVRVVVHAEIRDEFEGRPEARDSIRRQPGHDAHLDGQSASLRALDGAAKRLEVLALA